MTATYAEQNSIDSYGVNRTPRHEEKAAVIDASELLIIDKQLHTPAGKTDKDGICKKGKGDNFIVGKGV